FATEIEVPGLVVGRVRIGDIAGQHLLPLAAQMQGFLLEMQRLSELVDHVLNTGGGFPRPCSVITCKGYKGRKRPFFSRQFQYWVPAPIPIISALATLPVPGTSAMLRHGLAFVHLNTRACARLALVCVLPSLICVLLLALPATEAVAQEEDQALLTTVAH